MREQYNITVIIPTYNAEKEIEKCLDSVFCQTEKSIEVICVDDGSTDSTIDVIKRYASKQSSIIIKEQMHKGAGAARNIGIDLARGEFVAFLDSDDCYYQKNALERMRKACIENDVMACGSFLINNVDGKLDYINIFPDVVFEDEKGRIVSFSEYQNDFYYQCFLFKREIFSDTKLRFPLYKRYQDPPLLLSILVKLGRFWVEPVYLYEYFYSNTHDKDVKGINDVLMGIRDNLDMAVRNDYHLLFKRLLERLDNYYYTPILENATEETIEQLSSISKMVRKSKWDDSFILMSNVVERIRDYKNICEANYLLSKMLDIFNGNYNKEYVDTLKKEKIVVYGVGYFGTKLIRCLDYLGIEVLYALDKNKAGDKYQNIKVKNPKENTEEALIIVALLNPTEVINELDGAKVISISEILTNLVY